MKRVREVNVNTSAKTGNKIKTKAKTKVKTKKDRKAKKIKERIEELIEKTDFKAKPVRKIEWTEKNGIVELKVIKFKGKFGKWLCKMLKRPNYFIISLDEIGSFIWKKCNGENSIQDILHDLEEKYGEELMKERLIIFLHMLGRYGYIGYKE